MQPTNSAQALQNLQAFQQSMKAPTDILTQQREQLGVPGMQTQVSGLRQAITNTTNLLNQVAPSIYGRTGGSLVTSAQAGRQIANEQAPIAQQLQARGQEYSGAQSDLDRALAQASQLTGLEVQGQQQRLGALESVYGILNKKEQEELARQMEERKLQESIRQFNAQLARSGGGGINLDSLKPPTPENKKAVPLSDKDRAFVSVRDFLAQGPAAAESDFRATLESANRGNAIDKLKVELYKQNGIGNSGGSSGGGTSYNIFTNQGASNLRNAITNKTSGLFNAAGNRLQSNWNKFF